MTRRIFHSFLTAVLFVGLLGCGKSGTNLDGKAEVAPPPPSTKDMLAKYAEFVKGDLAAIEAAYKGKFGDKAPVFNEDFLKFLVETDPILKDMPTLISYQFLIAFGPFSLVSRRPVRELAPVDSEKLEKAEDLEEKANEEEQRISLVNGLNSFFLLIQSRLVQEADIFGLNVKAAVVGDFTSDKFLPQAQLDFIKGDIKEVLNKLLFSVTLNVDGQFLSFIQFIPSTPPEEGSRLSLKSALAKFPVLIPALENPLFRDGVKRALVEARPAAVDDAPAPVGGARQAIDNGVADPLGLINVNGVAPKPEANPAP